jgi:hypothetical protein
MCNISVQTFDRWVRKGILPGPIFGSRRWSRGAIEEHLSSHASVPPSIEQPSPFNQWKRDHAR